MTTLKETIPFEMVRSVYTGKARQCCCGCAGKHTYVRAHRCEASAKRGYDVEEHEINDAAAKRVYNQIIGDPTAEVNEAHGYISVETDTRLKVVYFKH